MKSWRKQRKRMASRSIGSIASWRSINAAAAKSIKMTSSSWRSNNWRHHGGGGVLFCFNDGGMKMAYGKVWRDVSGRNSNHRNYIIYLRAEKMAAMTQAKAKQQRSRMA